MVTAKVKIGDRLVGEGEPCFVIAEAGVNHNGDIGLAKKLVDAAKEAGADAVKFQTFKADEVITKSAEKAQYQQQTTGAEGTQYDMVKRLELADGDFGDLSSYAQTKGIMFLSTPYDEPSVDLLARLGVPAFKISSADITNLPLLRHIAGKKKPVILSTGMATLEEVESALGTLRQAGGSEIVLLHCVTNYPIRDDEAAVLPGSDWLFRPYYRHGSARGGGGSRCLHHREALHSGQGAARPGPCGFS